MIYNLVLPYPPSANTYWRRVGNMTILSKAAREYKKQVSFVCAESGITKIEGAISIKRILYCPDYRRRDIDNTTKAIYDALKPILQDDSFIVRDMAEKRIDPEGHGKVLLFIETEKSVIQRKAGAWLL